MGVIIFQSLVKIAKEIVVLYLILQFYIEKWNTWEVIPTNIIHTFIICSNPKGSPSLILFLKVIITYVVTYVYVVFRDTFFPQ